MEGRRTALPAFKDASSSLLRKCWFCIFVANFVEALVEKCTIRQRLRRRLPTKFSAPPTFATALPRYSITAAFALPGVQEKRGHVPAVQSRAAPWTAAARRRFCFTSRKRRARLNLSFSFLRIEWR